MINSKNLNLGLLTILALFLIVILATSFDLFSPNIVDYKGDVKYTKRGLMCAPVGRVERDVECENQPLALRIKATWN